jgi:hypothetical protein
MHAKLGHDSLMMAREQADMAVTEKATCLARLVARSALARLLREAVRLRSAMRSTCAATGMQSTITSDATSCVPQAISAPAFSECLHPVGGRAVTSHPNSRLFPLGYTGTGAVDCMARTSSQASCFFFFFFLFFLAACRVAITDLLRAFRRALRYSACSSAKRSAMMLLPATSLERDSVSSRTTRIRFSHSCA